MDSSDRSRKMMRQIAAALPNTKVRLVAKKLRARRERKRAACASAKDASVSWVEINRLCELPFFNLACKLVYTCLQKKVLCKGDRYVQFAERRIAGINQPPAVAQLT
jgi:hypothetical protein